MSSPPSRSALRPATRAVQALHRIDALTGGVAPPLDLSTTYARGEDGAVPAGIVYGRDGTTTVRLAEAVLADLDGGAASMAFASGMSAIVALFETLEAGDRLVMPSVTYHGTRIWAERLAARRGIELALFDPASPGALEAAVPGARLVWIESPVNPLWDVIDIAAAAGAAHATGARLAVDCTAAPPVTTEALALGADLVFHSATKYMGGHSDLLAGVLTCRDEDALWAEIRDIRTLTGTALSPFPAWLLIRGLRTLWLRWERASASAQTLAERLASDARVARVRYPGLPDHPGHAVAARQMRAGFGGMLSIEVAGDRAGAARVAAACRVFLHATSLGGVESLIEHRVLVEPPGSHVGDTLLRLSVGSEHVEDLWADLDQALGRL